jgi:O-methyltransferase
MRFSRLKYILTRIGALTLKQVIHYGDGVLNYLGAGRWFRDRGIEIPKRVASREALYTLISSQVAEPTTYVEFGVFEGEATREWLRLLSHPASEFHGFDSFEGLPETWGLKYDRKTFDVGGRIPQFCDPRVTFHKGWFTETLPVFLNSFAPDKQLIVHLDADLYNSTIYPLRQLRSWLTPGTILIFDEFFDREHEMKALSEFVDEERINLRCLAATHMLTQVAFQRTVCGSY